MEPRLLLIVKEDELEKMLDFLLRSSWLYEK